jgi:hypothetical protein
LPPPPLASSTNASIQPGSSGAAQYRATAKMKHGPGNRSRPSVISRNPHRNQCFSPSYSNDSTGVDCHELSDKLSGWAGQGMLHYSGEGEAPLVDKPTYALLRRSRTMIRWSLYGLVDDRRTVTVGMFRETVLLLKESKAGRAWSSFQKYEVGWGGLRTNYSDRLSALTGEVPRIPLPRTPLNSVL